MVILAAWLLLAPLVLGYAQSRLADAAYVVGVGIAMAALLALIEPRAWEEWMKLALAAWLIVSPFALDVRLPVPAWNHVLIGLLVGAHALMTIVHAPAPRRVPRISARP